MDVVFKNEPERDFSQKYHLEELNKAFLLVDKNKGKQFPLIINGEKIFTDEKIASVNPANKNEVICYASSATTEHANLAIEAAAKAFESWRKTTVKERIEYIEKLIENLNKRRYELTAVIVEESGKNWAEAEGEICEAIDFFRSYAIGMMELDKGLELLQSDEEDRKCNYIPVGVGVMIPPWNFPFALVAGMVSSALITGNTVVMKPSQDTPAVAYMFMEILEQTGFPKGVINFISGRGSVIGDPLVEHPKTRFINFTGSKQVGLGISELASKTSSGQIWIKRVVAEMGGKNAIIVDSSADLKEVAKGVINSAFSFQGQKCSACSRLLVMEDVYDETIQELTIEVKKLEQGSGRENYISGPVVNQKSFNDITNYIEIGKKEGRVIAGGNYNCEKGFFIEPTIIADTSPNAVIAKEEIFGPVLAVIKVDSFDQAIKIANDTEYGLTGGVYSKNRDNIQKAVEDFMVGNLYINRKCTGAVVKQNPFGGFNMSGTDAKTGTKDYLLNFLQLKSVTELN